MSNENKMQILNDDVNVQVSSIQLKKLIDERDFYKNQMNSVKTVSNNLINKFIDEKGEIDLSKITNLLVPMGKQLMMMKFTKSETAKAEILNTLKAEIGLEEIQEIQKIMAANE